MAAHLKPGEAIEDSVLESGESVGDEVTSWMAAGRKAAAEVAAAQQSTSRVAAAREAANLWAATQEEAAQDGDAQDCTFSPECTFSPGVSLMRSYFLLDDHEDDHCISKHTVLAFVDQLEEADEYFRFKSYLKAECDMINDKSLPWDIAYNINAENERSKRFPLIEDEDVFQAVWIYIEELKQKDLEQFYRHKAVRDPLSTRNPVYSRLLQCIEEGYVLDQDPEVEIKIIRKLAPLFFRDSLLEWKQPVEVEVGTRTVIVSNIPLAYDDKSIRKWFGSCGCIRYFETESTSEFRTAHITYKESSGAESALEFSGTELAPVVSGSLVSWSVPMVVTLKAVEASSSTRSALEMARDVSYMHNEALEKYAALRKHYLQFDQKNVTIYDEDDERWRAEWMVVEAMVNGGLDARGNPLRGIRGPEAAGRVQ